LGNKIWHARPQRVAKYLYTDRNGELSTTEIVAAGTALLKLDRNGDGKLTPDELFTGPGGPPPGGMRGRPGDGQLGCARDVAHGIFHLAVGRGALRKRGLLGRAS
jgi:hypothetical protein